MKGLLERVSLRTFTLQMTSFCALVACLLLFFFARDIDKSYSNLLKKEIDTRTLIQSIFNKRIANYSNIIKIDNTTNLDTIEKYIKVWETLSTSITQDFIKLKDFIPKDSTNLSKNIEDIVKKRAVVIQQRKEILSREKENPSINIIDNSSPIDVNAYDESINTFLNNYNICLLSISNELTQRTLKKSNIYLLILPIPLVLLFFLFLYFLILFLRDFSTEE